MVKNRIKIYWLLLLVLLYTIFIMLSVGETHARYVNTVAWDTVVGETEDQVSSNLLRNVSDPPITILLGEMQQNIYEVPIILKSGVDVEGYLTWSVSPGNYKDYISVEMSVGDTVLSMDTAEEEKKPMQLLAGEPVTVLMRLTPTANAFVMAREAVQITIAVNWGNTLTGTFLVELPAVVQDPVVPAEENAELLVVQSEAVALHTEMETGVAAEEASAGNTSVPAAEITVTEDETPEEDPETSVPAAGGTETGDESSDTVEDPDPEPEVPPQQGEGAEGDAGSDSDDSTGEDSDPSEAPNPDEDATPDTDIPAEIIPPIDEKVELENIVIETMESDAAEELVSLQIVLPYGSTFMRLGMGSDTAAAYETNKDAALTLNEFPNNFCYSLDNGKSYYMLYHGGIIELETDGKTAVSVLVDFSKTLMAEETELVLAITAHNEKNVVGTGMNAVTVEKVQNVTLSSRFLTKGSDLTMDIPKSWQTYALEYELEMLTADEKTGKIGYVKVDPQKSGLKIATDKKTGALIVKMDKTLPKAGSYRICMNWMFEETCVEQAQETFFVHYSDYMDTVKTGGAEQ